MTSAPSSASIAATVLLPEPMPPVRPMTGRDMRAVGTAIARRSRAGRRTIWLRRARHAMTFGMADDGFEMRVDLLRGGAVSAAVAVPATHRPGRTPIVILAHGAGTDRRPPPPVRIQEGLRGAGWPTVVFNFPYREAGRRIPDARPGLEGCWSAVIDAVRAGPRPTQPCTLM